MYVTQKILWLYDYSSLFQNNSFYISTVLMFDVDIGALAAHFGKYAEVMLAFFGNSTTPTSLLSNKTSQTMGSDSAFDGATYKSKGGQK